MRIGFIGLGRMGSHMARHVLEGGHSLQVYDLRRGAAAPLVAKGAHWAASPRAAAENAELVFTSLPEPSDVLDVALGEGGVLEGLAPEAVFVDLSTVSPQTARRIGEVARKRGQHVLDCPVSGGVGGAEAGALCLMAGGERAVFERVKPVLDLIGDPSKVLYCGALGAGSICKLVNNLIALAANVLLAEAFTLGVNAGVDARTLFEVVSGSSGNTAAMQAWRGSVLRGDFEPGFALALAAKDMRLATDLGRQLGVPMPAANLADQAYVEAMRRGFGSESAAAVARLQEERSGVRIRYAEHTG